MDTEQIATAQVFVSGSLTTLQSLGGAFAQIDKFAGNLNDGNDEAASVFHALAVQAFSAYIKAVESLTSVGDYLNSLE